MEMGRDSNHVPLFMAYSTRRDCTSNRKMLVQIRCSTDVTSLHQNNPILHIGSAGALYVAKFRLIFAGYPGTTALTRCT